MSFHLDQLLLITALLFFVVYVSVLRTTLSDRIIYVLFALAGAIMVINPDLTTHLANLIGIGRGTDLLLYLFVMAAMFFSVGVVSELRRQRRQLTLLVREIALSTPAFGSGVEASPTHPVDSKPSPLP